MDILFYIISPLAVFGLSLKGLVSGELTPAIGACVFALSMTWLFTAVTLNFFSFPAILAIFKEARANGTIKKKK